MPYFGNFESNRTRLWKMKKNYLIIYFLLLVCTISANASSKYFEYSNIPSQNTIYYNSHKSKLEGFNIKLSPSFFWKTATLELEYPVTKHFSIGLNIFAKLGRWDGLKVNRTMPNEDYLNNGMAFELAGKFYIKPEAPEGFYVQANVAYNNFFYQDGTTRPFSFYSHWRDQVGASATTFKAPSPFQFGVGVGYQVIILPKHFIGNVMIGTLGNFGGNDQFQFSIYLAPSLGYVF